MEDSSTHATLSPASTTVRSTIEADGSAFAFCAAMSEAR
jgi:hypothetical protein